MADNLIMALSAAEAVALKDGKSAFLAGGTEDNRLGTTVDAATLISIGRIKELDGISEYTDPEKQTKYTRIGAMCTFQDIVDSSLVPGYLREACLFMASRTKRNMATIGGNVALIRSDSYLYATLLACGARIDMMDSKANIVHKCAAGYLEEHEKYKDNLILAIMVPASVKEVASKRYSNTAQSHAVLTVSAGIVDGRLNLAVAARNVGIVRLVEIATALQGKELSDSEIQAMVRSDKRLSFKQDIFGSPEYKQYLLSVTIADLVKAVKGGVR